jgi:branched-chain amino acid transport system ATP-binding protein
MNESATLLLEVSGLVKRYGGLVAINNVDLKLRPGTITGVIGPNGAGKSTLIGLIGGAISPTQGSIRLDGRDVTRLPASERARAGIGRTYQNAAAFPGYDRRREPGSRAILNRSVHESDRR